MNVQRSTLNIQLRSEEREPLNTAHEVEEWGNSEFTRRVRPLSPGAAEEEGGGGDEQEGGGFGDEDAFDGEGDVAGEAAALEHLVLDRLGIIVHGERIEGDADGMDFVAGEVGAGAAVGAEQLLLLVGAARLSS